jgi:hypothetical protein
MFPDLPLQEMFTKITEHLLKQGKRSMYSKPSMYSSDMVKSCAYRGENGRTCAVGCLIPDEDYTPEMEGVGVSRLQQHWPDLFQFDGNQLDLLADLQNLHDCGDPKNLRDGLVSIASTYKLEMLV